MRTRVHAIMDTIWPLGFVLIALVSFGFETAGDLQLRRFRADPVVWFGLWLLVRRTGTKLLEKHMTRSKGAAYADYVQRTSGFIPWPPR